MSESQGLLPYELRARIIRKVLVSLALGGMTYAITELTNQPQIWSLTLSVFIGGVTLVVQFLVEFEGRLTRVEAESERHCDRVETMVEDGFAKISEATELFRLVEVAAVRTDMMTQLVRHATQIAPTAPPLVSRLAQSEIARVSLFLRDLSKGESLIYEGEDRDWLLALARHAQSSIDATSLTSVDAGGRGYTDGGLWTSDLGQRYLREQRAAARRGVRIRRVFVVDRPDPATDADLAEVCRAQREHGVEVRVLGRESVPPELRNRTHDFVLFDETISYESTAAPRFVDTGPPTILNTRLELEPGRVKVRVDDFKELWEAAQQVPEAA